MRTMLRMSIPTDAGNETLQNGTFSKVLEHLIEQIKPEASYFYAEGGERTAMMIFDLKDSSDIPVICEPLFSQLNAGVDLVPVMNSDDLHKALSRLS